MTGVGVSVTTEGFERLAAKLRTLGDIDYTPVLDRIGATVVEQTLERFEKEQDPTGRPWRPLQAHTVLRKLGGSRRANKKRGGLTKTAVRKLGSLKILQDSSWQGGLISTIHHQVGNGEVIIGANKVYAAIHQFGGAEVGKPGIPARPFLGMTSANIAEVDEVITDWMNRKLKA